MHIKKNIGKFLLTTTLALVTLTNSATLFAQEDRGMRPIPPEPQARVPEGRAPVASRESTPKEAIGKEANGREAVSRGISVAERRPVTTPVPVAQHAPVGNQSRQQPRQVKAEKPSKPAKRANWGFSLGIANGGTSAVVQRAPVGCETYRPCVRTIPVPAPRVVVVPAPTCTYYTSETADVCHFIYTLYNAGELIQLEDGSLWEIAPNALPWTKRWLRNEQITITRTRSAQYPFQLYNRQTREAVTAVLKVGASLSPREVFQDANTIVQVTAEGELIRLADQTLWELSETSRYTTRLWRAGESVEIVRSGQYTYPYLLTNRITGEVAEAKQMQAS